MHNYKVHLVFSVVNLTKETIVEIEDFQELKSYVAELKEDLINGDRIFIINPHDNYNIRPWVDHKGDMYYHHYIPKSRFRGFEWERRKMGIY